MQNLTQNGEPQRSDEKKKKGKARMIVSGLTFVGGLLACFTSQQHYTVSHGRICSDKCSCWHAEIEVADQTFFFPRSVTVYWHWADQSQRWLYIARRLAGQQLEKHAFEVTGVTLRGKKIRGARGNRAQIFLPRQADAFTTRPTRRCTPGDFPKRLQSAWGSLPSDLVKPFHATIGAGITDEEALPPLLRQSSATISVDFSTVLLA